MSAIDAKKKKIQVFTAPKHAKKPAALLQDLTIVSKSSPKPSVNARFSNALKAKLSP